MNDIMVNIIICIDKYNKWHHCKYFNNQGQIKCHNKIHPDF